MLSNTLTFDVPFTMTAAYDENGNLTKLVYPGGRKVETTYDYADRPATLTSTAPGSSTPETLVSEAAYLPFGPAETLIFDGGLEETREYSQRYLETGHLVQAAGPTTLLSRAYTYDARGFRTGNDSTEYADDRAFTYDDFGRLTAVTQSNIGYSETFTYDDLGNRLTDHFLPETNEEYLDRTYTYSQNGSSKNTALLTATATTTSGGTTNATIYSDAIGNVTQNEGSSFAYDLAGRLSSMNVWPSSEYVGTTDLGYDADGLRVVERYRNSSFLSSQHYLYGFHIGPRRSFTLGSFSYEFQHQTHTRIWETLAVYFGNRIVGRYFLDPDTETGDFYPQFPDPQGFPLLVTDLTGEVKWTGSATAFGSIWQQSEDPTWTPDDRYPGQWYDYLAVGTELFDNGYRVYNPGWGRYLTGDPVGRGAASIFAYVDSNPLSYVDLLGLRKCSAKLVDDFLTLHKAGEAIKFVVDAFQTCGNSYWKTQFSLADFHYDPTYRWWFGRMYGKTDPSRTFADIYEWNFDNPTDWTVLVDTMGHETWHMDPMNSLGHPDDSNSPGKNMPEQWGRRAVFLFSGFDSCCGCATCQ